MVIYRQQGITDAEGMAAAAAQLQVSEFELFARAYRIRFLEEAENRRLEHYFAIYLFSGDVPSWVRHYLCSLGIDFEPLLSEGSRFLHFLYLALMLLAPFPLQAPEDTAHHDLMTLEC